jgi:hypothetical protein
MISIMVNYLRMVKQKPAEKVTKKGNGK